MYKMLERREMPNYAILFHAVFFAYQEELNVQQSNHFKIIGDLTIKNIQVYHQHSKGFFIRIFF